MENLGYTAHCHQSVFEWIHTSVLHISLRHLGANREQINLWSLLDDDQTSEPILKCVADLVHLVRSKLEKMPDVKHFSRSGDSERDRYSK